MFGKGIVPAAVKMPAVDIRFDKFFTTGVRVNPDFQIRETPWVVVWDRVSPSAHEDYDNWPEITQGVLRLEK
jgi:hypothetical protein